MTQPIRQLTRTVLARIMEVAYRGDRFACPCCGGRFDRFRTYGDPPRRNARCPRCGSLERHRAIWLYLQNRTELFARPNRVLDVAPEAYLQRHLRSLTQLDCVSVDLESPLAMHHMDVTDLRFPNARFDVVFCNHVLEHVSDDRAAMRELLRVLKPGGWAILQTPYDTKRSTTDEDPSVVDPADRTRRFGQIDHVRMYGSDLFDRLREEGWQIEVLNVDSVFGSDVVRKNALIPADGLIVGRKPE